MQAKSELKNAKRKTRHTRTRKDPEVRKRPFPKALVTHTNAKSVALPVLATLCLVLPLYNVCSIVSSSELVTTGIKHVQPKLPRTALTCCLTFQNALETFQEFMENTLPISPG